MSLHHRRAQKRKKVCIQAFVADPEDINQVKCVIRDVSENGCQIVSSQVQYLPDILQLIPEGFDKPIRGKIVWRDKNLAGMCFESACSAEDRARIEALYHSVKDNNEEDIVVLRDKNKPLSYTDRLKKYNPQRK